MRCVRGRRTCTNQEDWRGANGRRAGNVEGQIDEEGAEEAEEETLTATKPANQAKPAGLAGFFVDDALYAIPTYG